MNILKFCLLLYLCLVNGGHGQAARILGMFPLFARSHHNLLQAIMKTLAAAGHEVVVYSPFPMEHPPPNYSQVHLQNITTEGAELSKFFLDMAELPSWKCLDAIWLIDETIIREIMQEEKIKALLKSEEKFDLVITEAFSAQEVTLMVGNILKIPTIVLQGFHTNSLVNSYSGNSLSLSYVPDVCFGYSNKMTFMERLFNSFAILRGLFFTYIDYIPRIEGLMKKEFPNMPPLLDLIDNVSLVIVNDHLTADYSRPRTPNIIPVAGIHIQDVKTLPKDIKKFMDEAKDGVILFSLGTYVEDQLLPKEYFDMYVTVFKQLRQRVLWKTRKELIDGLPDNVMALKWMPQPDILAHPNCVLFLTHGGLFSTHEAIHFGVPVVGIPQFYDQHRNVKFFEDQGVGVKLDAKGLTDRNILVAIQEVISDHRYADNMRRLSKIFRDRPLTPAQSVVYWTEYVLRHGGAAHLKPASTRLHWYQLALLDILAVVLAAALSLVAALYLLVRRVLLTLTRIKEKRSGPVFEKKIK